MTRHALHGSRPVRPQSQQRLLSAIICYWPVERSALVDLSVTCVVRAVNRRSA
jgi:hypothetical protein